MSCKSVCQVAQLLAIAAGLSLTSQVSAQSQLVTPLLGVVYGVSQTSGAASYSTILGQGVAFTLPDKTSWYGIRVPNFTDWTKVSHLGLILQNQSAFPVELYVQIDTSTGSTTGKRFARFELPAWKSGQIAVPLLPDPVDLQASGCPFSGYAMPQGDGSYTPSDFRRVIFQTFTPGAKILLKSVNGLTGNYNYTKFVDQYGQMAKSSWTGKVLANADLATNEPIASPAYDNYGAAWGAPVITSTRGRYSTVDRGNGAWSLATPEGKLFYSLGVNEVLSGRATTTQGRENYFAWLPSSTDSLADHYSTQPNMNGVNAKGFNFVEANLERKFGSGWLAAASDEMANRMNAWKFNTVGAGSSTLLYRRDGITFTYRAEIGGSHKHFAVPFQHHGPMHDVFDPQFAVDTESTLANVLSTYGTYANLSGLFVDNELNWGDRTWGRNAYIVPMGALSASSSQPVKTQFIDDLEAKYSTIDALNAAWGTSFSSWAGMTATSYTPPTVLPSAMEQDFKNFLSHFADQYFKTVRAKLDKLNFKGLYLGCRFDHFTPEVLAAAQKYCNVLSFNIYGSTPSSVAPEVKALDFPVMISEFGFGATDRGRIGFELYQTFGEDQRVAAFNRYMTDAMTWKNLVGIHYYGYVDNPISGRFADDQNWTSGLVDVTDKPYPELTKAATQQNDTLMRLVNGS